VLLMACAIADAAPDFGGRMAPWKELQSPAAQGPQVGAFELRAFQVIAAGAKGDDTLDIVQSECPVDP